MLKRDFYMPPADIVAPRLLGKLLVHRSPEGLTGGMMSMRGGRTFQNMANSTETFVPVLFCIILWGVAAKRPHPAGLLQILSSLRGSEATVAIRSSISHRSFTGSKQSADCHGGAQ